MRRKYGSEFIAYLEATDQIGSYCAEDSQYIDWLEKHLEVCRDHLSKLKEVADDCRVSTADCKDSTDKGDNNGNH